jgi:hypothetical protein
MPVLDRDSDYTIASDQNYLIEIQLREWEIGKAWFLTFHHHRMWRASCLSPCRDPWHRWSLEGARSGGVVVDWSLEAWTLERTSDLGLANFIYTLPCWELELGHHSRNLGGMGLLDLLACWADSGFVGKQGWVNGSYTRTHGTRWVQFFSHLRTRGYKILPIPNS